jgi:antitoxin (DNA-binding transcriptional repressor) of toxin-antitoxin stability system
METQIIGVKQLYKNLKRISEAAINGESFLVVRNSKPVFRIEPVKKIAKKKHTMEDLWKIRFKGKDRDLSKNIDKILYKL